MDQIIDKNHCKAHIRCSLKKTNKKTFRLSKLIINPLLQCLLFGIFFYIFVVNVSNVNKTQKLSFKNNL